MTFRMKQFYIRQERSALKVGTDGVLLGAYVGAHHPTARRLLDVGTGTGVIALMVAQQLPDARIDGIEVDRDSALEAEFNASQSPFSGRIQVFHKDFTDFSTGALPYDIIVSNPPYFTPTHTTADSRVTTAKHIGVLSPETFFEKSERLLSEQGQIIIIVATSAIGGFLSAARTNGFEVKEMVYVRTIPGKSPKRVIVTLGRKQSDTSDTKINYLTIQKSGARHDYTDEYRTLLSPFLTIFS